MFYQTLLASKVVRASDEDLCSQLNHIWSALLLIGLGLLISMVQYVGEPIHCLCPASMPDAHCNYTKALCWVKESYFPDEDNSPLAEVSKSEHRFAYYPWAPWILFFMATALKLPHLIWYSFSYQSDLDIGKLVSLADEDEDLDNLAKVIRIWLIRTKRQYTDVFHKAKRLLSLMGFFWLGHHKRTFLTGLIICVKVMYLAVSVGLFFSLNLFLDEHFTAYGWEVVKDFLNGMPQTSSKFPKQIVCNIKIRQMNNVHRYSIQCILPINLYNQKIFVFLWFWFIILTIMNTYSLLRWAYKLLSPYQRWKFVKNYVHILSHLDREAKRLRRQTERYVNGNAHRDDTPRSIPNGGLLTMGEQGLVLNLASEENSANLRARRGSVRSISTDNSITRPKKRKRKKSQTPILRSIEINQDQYNESIIRRKINEDTTWMLKNLGHDGVLVFRTLESAVGIVISNQIFHSLHKQIMDARHHSET